MSISNQYYMVGQLKHCGKGASHEGKAIMMICLNAECEARRLCCLTCIDELHRKHELISLNRFETMLSILHQQMNPDVKSAVLAQIHAFEQEILNGLDALQMKFIKNIEKSKNKVKEILAQTYESLNMQLSTNVIHEFYSKFSSSEVCRYLQLIRRAEADTFKDLENTQRVLKLGRAIFEKQGNESDKLQDKQFEDINKSIEKIRLTLNQPYTTKKRAFSKIHKAPCITVNEEQDIAHRSQGAGGYPVVIVEDALTECNDNVTVVIKQQPSSKGIWLGVCVLDIVKNFNYSGCYGMNKGSWAIDQVGINHQSAYSWSHHDTNYNSQPKVGWQINTGDIVNIKVDFAKSVVIFTRGTDKYEQPIKLDLGDIYVFVGCTHIGDTWGLV